MLGQGWIGCDLDGTLAVALDTYEPTVIGAPVPKMVERVKSALADGKDVRIFTARVAYVSPELLVKIEAAIQKFCFDNIGKVLPITCVKDHYMTELWDDRASQVELNTGVFVRFIPNGSAGNGTDRAMEFMRVIKDYFETYQDPNNWPVDDRDNMFEMLRSALQAVPQKFWSRLGIGYSNVSGQSFPEACALVAPKEAETLGPQGEPIALRGRVEFCVACDCGGCEEHRYSEDQPRDEHGRFGSGGTSSKEYTPPESKTSRPDFAGVITTPSGEKLSLSQDRGTKLAEVKAFADREMAKLPIDVQMNLNAGTKTSDLFKGEDGKYTAERVSEYHNPTVDAALNGHEAQVSPQIVFVGGGPAAGKSTAAEEAARSIGDHVNINVDSIRTSAPEFTALLPDRLMPVNEETGDIRDRIMQEAGSARYNLLVDGVGSNSAAENVAKLVESGYTASYVYVHREAADARARADDRPYLTKNVADLRILPKDMVEKFHDKAREAFAPMSKVSSEIKVIDKSDPKGPKEGTVVFWKDTSGVRVYNPEGVRRVENGGKVKIRIYP
jgi:hypothetical protein